jgi:7-cyano-7-deazaguanine synthase
MRRIGIVLLSGGLDSTTAAAVAQREGVELMALTVYYGQSHARELASARRVAQILGIPHRVIEAPFFGELASFSALTHPRQHPRPLDRLPDAMTADIPVTYVPLRNTYLLTLAAAALESAALEAIEAQGTDPVDLSAAIVIGANAIDYSGYPDCRPEYYQSAAETLRLGSKLGTSYGVAIEIATPLIDKTKADIVRLAAELGAPIEHTWSCYSSGPRPCGRCDSCVLRAKGFREAGIPDPALVATIAEA